MTEQIDKFQPIAVMQMLDEKRMSLGSIVDNPPTHLTQEQWRYIVEGMRLALAWAKVEVETMAFDPMRFKP
jgi:hypothetical protein